MNIRINKDNDFIYRLHANICKTFASPVRIMIIDQLQSGPMTVTDLERATGVRQATLSQHLAILRDKGIVTAERDGQHIYYGVTNKKIFEACRLMREVLLEQIENYNLLREGLNDNG